MIDSSETINMSAWVCIKITINLKKMNVTIKF